jgi:hypothetical protein
VPLPLPPHNRQLRYARGDIDHWAFGNIRAQVLRGVFPNGDACTQAEHEIPRELGGTLRKTAYNIEGEEVDSSGGDASERTLNDKLPWPIHDPGNASNPRFSLSQPFRGVNVAKSYVSPRHEDWMDGDGVEEEEEDETASTRSAGEGVADKTGVQSTNSESSNTGAHFESAAQGCRGKPQPHTHTVPAGSHKEGQGSSGSANPDGSKRGSSSSKSHNKSRNQRSRDGMQWPGQEVSGSDGRWEPQPAQGAGAGVFRGRYRVLPLPAGKTASSLRCICISIFPCKVHQPW